MNVGNHPFVTDVRENINVTLPNGRSITTRWIQFKVPIDKSYYLDQFQRLLPKHQWNRGFEINSIYEDDT